MLFIAALFIVVEVWKLPQWALVVEQISKLWHVHVVLQKEGVPNSVMWEYSKIHCKGKNPKSKIIQQLCVKVCGGGYKKAYSTLLIFNKITLGRN